MNDNIVAIEALANKAIPANLRLNSGSQDDYLGIYAIGDNTQMDDDINAVNEFHAAANPEFVLSLIAELRQRDARIAELERMTNLTMGVGDGSGNLFVHGDHDSIRVAQQIVFRMEKAEAEIARRDAVASAIDYKKLSAEIVDNLVDCDEAEEERYLAWTEKTIRAAMLEGKKS